MPFDTTEILKLSVEEKRRIILELEKSIGEEISNAYDNGEEESPEIIALLEERWIKYKKGESRSYSINQVKMLEKDIKERRNNSFNDQL